MFRTASGQIGYDQHPQIALPKLINVGPYYWIGKSGANSSITLANHGNFS